MQQMDVTDMIVLVGPLDLISIDGRRFDCGIDECNGYDGFGRATRSYFNQQDEISTGGMPYLPHACMHGGR